jgi:tetratricopeptide (TPR) repeat protein
VALKELAMPDVKNRKKHKAWLSCGILVALILAVCGLRYRFQAPNPSPDEAWEVHSNAAYGALDANHYTEAERAARLALAGTSRFGLFDGRRAESLNLVGRACSGQRKYEDAEAFYRQAIAAYRRAPLVDERHLADVMCNLGDDYRIRGRIADAIRVFKEVDALDDARVSPNDIERVRHLDMEVLLQMRLKRYSEARALSRKAYGIRCANPDRDSGDEGANLKVIAMTYAYEGNYSRAETVCAKAIPLLIAGEGPDAPGVGRALRIQANVLSHEGKLTKAEPLYVRAIGIFQRDLGTGSPDLGGAMDDYAVLLTKMHRNKEAAAYRAKASTIPAKRSVEP